MVYTNSMGLGEKLVWKCDVCNHEWLSRDDSKPLRCANCKTPYWDKDKLTLEQARQAMKLKKQKRAKRI